MSNLLHETRILLGEAAKHPLLRDGRHPGKPIHRNALERWRTRGVGGIVLETVKIGGLRYTSVEAIERFIERLNTSGAGPETVTPRTIAKAHAQAKRELKEAGMPVGI